MADKKISELTNITGSTIADADEFVVVDASANETKAITASELRTAIGNGDFTVTGNLTVQGTTITVDSATAQNIVLGDNDKMTFGDAVGGDLQIYHNSSNGNSYIHETGGGDLLIQGVDVKLRSSDDGANMLHGVENGSVTIYYNGSAKLATTNTGVDITGTLTSDGLTVDGSPVSFNSTAPMLHFMETGVVDSNHRIRQNAGNLYFQKLSDDTNTATTRMVIDGGNGSISFYEDTGTTPKFFWDASAESLGIGTSSPATHGLVGGLVIGDGTGNQGITLFGTTTSQQNIAFTDIAGDQRGLIQYDHGAGGTDYMRFFTASSERVRIDSSGNVGIGTSSPDLVGSTTSLTINSSGGNGQLSLMGNGTVYGRIFADNATGDLKMGNPTSNDVMFYTANLERMRIDSSGNVGIGTTSPDAKLDVSRTGNGQIAVLQTSANRGFSFESQSDTALQIASVQGSTNLDLWANTLTFSAGASERMRIDSSGRVGIGTTSPTYKMQVKGDNSASGGILLQGTAGSYGLQIYHNGPADTSYIYNYYSGPMLFGTNNTERMRIDSSGNLLVGKTSATTFNTEGIELRANDIVWSTRTSGPSLELNRLSTDGDIAIFYKDGSTVGSIGTQGGDLWVGTGDTAAYFWDGSNAVAPWNPSTNTTRDAAIDLGQSGARFKDLYLSGGVKFDGVTKLQGDAYIIGGSATNGIRFNNSNDSQNNVIMNDDGSTWFRNGIYLGATSNPSAANHLDDYEEGTFTISLKGSTTNPSTTQAWTSHYTKVGRNVTVFIPASTLLDSTGASGYVYFDGLPFAATTSTTGTVMSYNGGSWSGSDIVSYVSGSSIYLYQNTSGGAWATIPHIPSGSVYYVINATYFTS